MCVLQCGTDGGNDLFLEIQFHLHDKNCKDDQEIVERLVHKHSEPLDGEYDPILSAIV